MLPSDLVDDLGDESHDLIRVHVGVALTDVLDDLPELLHCLPPLGLGRSLPLGRGDDGGRSL